MRQELENKTNDELSEKLKQAKFEKRFRRLTNPAGSFRRLSDQDSLSIVN